MTNDDDDDEDDYDDDDDDNYRDYDNNLEVVYGFPRRSRGSDRSKESRSLPRTRSYEMARVVVPGKRTYIPVSVPENRRREHNNRVFAQEVMLNKKITKPNHRRELELLTYRDPPQPNKAVIRGGAVVYK